MYTNNYLVIGNKIKLNGIKSFLFEYLTMYININVMSQSCKINK